MFTHTHSKQQKAEGYIVIVVLLLAAVLLMLGLSFAARTTEQVFLSTQEEDTTRVFNAAESGIEQALYNLDTGIETATEVEQDVIDSGAVNNADVRVTAQRIENASITVRQGETLTLYPSAGAELSEIRFTDPSGNCAGLLVTVYRGTEARHNSWYAKRASGCDTNTLANETASSGSLTLSAGVFTLRINSNTHFGYPAFQTTDMIRVTPLFNDVTFTRIAATQIRATASDNLDGDAKETRRIEVMRTEPGPPSVFDYAVFSGGDLVKNN